MRTQFSVHIFIVFYFVGTRFEHTSFRLEVDKNPETQFDDIRFSISLLYLHNFGAILIFAAFNQNRNELHEN